MTRSSPPLRARLHVKRRLSPNSAKRAEADEAAYRTEITQQTALVAGLREQSEAKEAEYSGRDFQTNRACRRHPRNRIGRACRRLRKNRCVQLEISEMTGRDPIIDPAPKRSLWRGSTAMPNASPKSPRGALPASQGLRRSLWYGLSNCHRNPISRTISFSLSSRRKENHSVEPFPTIELLLYHELIRQRSTRSNRR